MSKTTDSISCTCVLCCGGIKYYAVGLCNHHICLKCSVRMRVLCEQKYCGVCRTVMAKVIATAKQHPYEGIISHKFHIDRKAGIAFANSKILDEFRCLLYDACTICTLRAPEKSFKELQDHMRKDHELFYCDLCIKHLKVFPSERKTYSRKDLGVHRRKGDGKDTSYRGHPMCEFCDERYFDNDELLRHLRKDHYFCHFCETDGVSHQYYNDYNSLKEHFREQHYLCEEDSCAQEQFTHAFRSSIDMKAHRATAHSSQMSRAQARQMRQLDVEINLPPRISDRGGVPDFVRGRERRHRELRDDGLSTAIQASLETKRREIAAKQDTKKSEREDGETKRPKDRRQQAKNKSPASSEPETSRDDSSRKLKKSSEDGNVSKGAVAVETKEAVKEHEGKTRDGGRVSPNSKVETKTETEDKVKYLPSSRNVDSVDDKKEQKAKPGVPDPVETGSKKKKKKAKIAPDKTNTARESSQSTPTHEDERHTKNVSSDIGPSDDYPSLKSNIADLEAKSAKIAWTSSKAKSEDFPALGAPSVAKISGNSSAGGFNFYSALQKMDLQPKFYQQQPVAMPAQRSFKNKDEDFPTLSSIAGILGVEPMRATANPKPKTNGASAWSASKGKTTAQPPETAVKSKKKGKKSAKETPNNVTKDPISKPPPEFKSQKDAIAISCERQTNPQRLPPGLSIDISTSTTTTRPPPPGLTKMSVAPPIQMTSSIPVGPPPGFGASIYMSDSPTPPGLDIYINPSDFIERNQILAAKMQSILWEEDKFNMFKSISRKFREGSLTAAEYYAQCKTLLGDNLTEIFSELVALLPDAVKQRELISAQKDDDFRVAQQTEHLGSRGKGRGHGEWKSKLNTNSSCPQCGMIVQQAKLQAHLTKHQEFPSLSAGAVGNRHPMPAVAPTWSRVK